MNTAIAILVIVALIYTVFSAMGNVPIWPAVLLLCVAELLQVLPLK